MKPATKNTVWLRAVLGAAVCIGWTRGVARGAIPEHAAITEYKGPQTCVACHPTQTHAVFGSVHYQWSGPTPAVSNIEGNAGKADVGFNTYCGSPLGSRHTACWSCHAGNGKVPQSEVSAGQLNNIDCMMCHSDAYQRKAVAPFPTGDFNLDRYVDFIDVSRLAGGWLDSGLAEPDLTGNGDVTFADYSIFAGYWGDCTSGDAPCNFQWTETLSHTDYLGVHRSWTLPKEDAQGNLQFGPDTGKMTVSIVEAARNVHLPTRASCLRCHATAGGGDGTKRGDLSGANVSMPRAKDVHMGSDGADLACYHCHASSQSHREKGRGVDLRPSDSTEPMTCTGGHCHPSDPHDSLGLNLHTDHVACQTCHIPAYAKDGVSTEVARDWSRPFWAQGLFGGQGGYKPEEIRADNLTPTYAWYDGTSYVYVLGQVAVRNAAGQYELAAPHGDVWSADAKIHPMKEHVSNSALHDATGRMIPHVTSTFFFTGDFSRAVEEGMANVGLSGSWSLVDIHTFQSINHGVEPEENALACGQCHSSLSGGPVRMDLKGDLGYAMKAPLSTVCAQCYGYKNSKGFSWDHDKHVTSKKYDCSWCHSFSRPQRGLKQPQ